MASLVRKKGPILTPGKKKPTPIKPSPKGGKNPKLPYRSKDDGFAPRGKPKPKNPKPIGRLPGSKIDPRLPRPPRRDPGYGPKKPAPGYKPGMPKKPTPVKPKPKGGNIRDLLYRLKPGEKLQRGSGTSLNNNKMYKTGEVNPSKLNNEKIRKDIFPMKQKLNDMMSRKPGRITKPVMPRRGGR
jgi:hypothetical protein